MARAAVGLVALCLFGCTGPPIRTYSGLKRPAAEIAVLKHQTGFNNPSVYFIWIDGSPLAKPQYADIEFLPGRHEVEFGYEAVKGDFILTIEQSTGFAKLAFWAEAGHQYEARAEPPEPKPYSPPGGRWRGTIVDLGTDRVVADTGGP